MILDALNTILLADALLKDLRECVQIVKSLPPIDADAIKAMVGAALQSPDPEAAFGQLTGSALPSEVAFINEVMAPLPDKICNMFLVNYMNDLYAKYSHALLTFGGNIQ